MAAAKLPVVRFMGVTEGFLKEVNRMISVLIEERMTNVTTDALRFAIGAIKGYSGEKLILAFIECNDDWVQVKDRNIKFFTKTVPKSYTQVPFDVKILTVPIKQYKKLIRAGNFRGDTNQDNWPVADADIDNMWNFFTAMIKISCNHVSYMRKSNPDYAKTFNIAKYEAMFNFTVVD